MVMDIHHRGEPALGPSSLEVHVTQEKKLKIFFFLNISCFDK